MRLNINVGYFRKGVDIDRFAFKFYLYRVVPINYSWLQVIRDIGLPDSEDRIPNTEV